MKSVAKHVKEAVCSALQAIGSIKHIDDVALI